MDSFNIKMIFQRTKWWPILTVIKVCLILYLLHKLLKFMIRYVERFYILQPDSVPGINIQLLCLNVWISLYKKSTSECLLLCAFFQTVIGFCHLYGKNGLLGVHQFFQPIVIFFKAEAVEAILSSAELIDKSDGYRFMQPSLGTGLITSQGTKWRKHRKILTPAFHFSILKECIPVFQEQANVLISKIKSQIQEPWIDIMPLLSLCSLDIICQTAMGVSMNVQKKRNCDYPKAIQELEEAIFCRNFLPWLFPDIIFNLTTLGKKFNSNTRLVHEFRRKVMRRKMGNITNTSTFGNKSNQHSFERKMPKPFLELLLEYNLKDPSFTENNVKEEVDTFLAAGHDTTAAAISWTLYCLGIYPEVQRQVQEELDAIFENEVDENFSHDVLAKMKYLECVIKETLRLYPVIPFAVRKSYQDFKALNYTVKKGTVCVILFWELHRDPAIFPDPEKFNPERFLPEKCSVRHPYAYAPFSAGPRNCIGQKFAMLETKTVLACILRRFQVKSLDPRDKVLVSPSVTLRNIQPFRLTFEPR